MTEIEFQFKLTNLQGSLMNYAFSLTTNSEEAKDLVQETFLKALRYCDKFVYDTNFKGWICTILKNTFINNYNRTIRNNTFSDQSKEGIYINSAHAPGEYIPDSVYTSHELEKAIDSLDDSFKLPFKMQNEGFKYKEIAETLDLNIGTVKSRIFMARKKLIKQLNR